MNELRSRSWTEELRKQCKTADGGGIDDAAPATVHVLSGKETPTVKFSTDSIDIDEGDSETVHLLADGMQGDEVGAVSVAVRGEMLSFRCGRTAARSRGWCRSAATPTRS